MSLADAFKHLAPDTPDYQASYRVIYFEPIANSGERFSIGVMAQDEQGHGHCVQTITIKQMRCMYGKQANAFNNIVMQILDSANQHLQEQQPISGWIPPFTGITISETYNTRSNAGMEGVLFQALTSYASLYRGELVDNGLNEHLDEHDIEEDDEPTIRLISQVRKILLRQNPGFSDRWGKTFYIHKAGRITIDYSGAHYNSNIANFDVKSIDLAYTIAQAKLFNLEVLRDMREKEAIENKQSYELLVACDKSNSYAMKQLNNIKAQAKSRELMVYNAYAADDMAARIIQMDAA